MDFKLHSQFRPTGDQPQAIEALTRGLNMGLSDQVLLGVTGSGKTFTMANIIANVNRPTLVLAHGVALRGKPIQIARRQAPEAAVAEARVGFTVVQVFEFDTVIGQHAVKHLGQIEVVEVVFE